MWLFKLFNSSETDKEGKILQDMNTIKMNIVYKAAEFRSFSRVLIPQSDSTVGFMINT